MGLAELATTKVCRLLFSKSNWLQHVFGDTRLTSCSEEQRDLDVGRGGGNAKTEVYQRGV
jgi:hypothetical protein